MALLDLIRGNRSTDETDTRVIEVLSDMTKVVGQNEVLEERISELETFIEDVGWERIYGYGDDFQFTRSALRDIIRLSRLYYVKNPIIRRPVDLQAFYVWAQGYEIKSENTALNDVVQRFIEDPSNQRALTGPEACLDAERKLRVEGNLFLGFYTNLSNGRVQVRRFKVDEMQAIVYSDDDDTEPRFYLREWTSSEGAQRRYYPDWNYVRALRAAKEAGTAAGKTDSVREELIGEVRIDWDIPVLHRKTGGFSDMDFGVPETYPALDWAKAYKELLEDYKKTVKALAKWAMVLKKEGASQAQITAIQQRLQSTLGSVSSSETNPPPATGSTFVANDSIDLKALDVSKASVDPAKFKFIMLMACAAMNMPSNFYGDSSDGNQASAKTLDRPTELGFRSRQNLWGEVFVDCCTIAIEAAALAPKSKKVQSAGYDEDTGLMKIKADRVLTKVDIDMNFPPILQQDVQSVVQSLVTGITLNGQPIQVMNDGPTILRILLKALGIDEIDDIVEVFYPKDGSKSTAKPIKTYAKPAAPGEKPAPADGPASTLPSGADGATLIPAQQAAQKNEPTKAPKQSGPPQAPVPPAVKESSELLDSVRLLSETVAKQGDRPISIQATIESQPAAPVTVNVPEQPAPVVTVNVPAAEAPVVTVNVPEQKPRRVKRESKFVTDSAGKIVGKSETETEE